jgi:hypothetical protein
MKKTGKKYYGRGTIKIKKKDFKSRRNRIQVR